MLMGSSARSVARRAASASRWRPRSRRRSRPSRPPRRTPTARASGTRGLDLVEHLHVVRRLERRSGEHHAAARLLEHVRQLVRAVRRVDVDEDHPDVGRGVLKQRPLGVVGAPQADPVAGLQPEPHQPGAEPLDPLRELVVGPPQSLVPRDQRLVGAVGGDVRRRLSPMVSSSRATSVGPAAVAGACVSVIAARLRQPAPTVVTASRTDGSTANDRHACTTEAGSVTSSTMQYSASHRLASTVCRV